MAAQIWRQTIRYYTGINSTRTNQDILSPPAFNFFIHEGFIEDNSILKRLEKNVETYISDIKKREKLIPKEHRHFLLNYYRLYNLFSDFQNQELKDLKEAINLKSQELLHELGIVTTISDSHAWLSLLHNGEQATRHCHIVKNEQSISWVLFTDTSKTALNIEAPHMINEDGQVKYNTYIKIHPEKGKMVFFPSWMFHFTDIHKEQNKRLSIAGKVILSN